MPAQLGRGWGGGGYLRSLFCDVCCAGTHPRTAAQLRARTRVRNEAHPHGIAVQLYSVITFHCFLQSIPITPFVAVFGGVKSMPMCEAEDRGMCMHKAHVAS